MDNKHPLKVRPPTLADIAAAAGVSAPTVAKVLSGRCGTTRVGEETKERIQKIALGMGYQKHVAAAQLSRGRTDAIGVVISRFGSPFYGKILTKLAELLGQERLSMLPLLCEKHTPPNKVSEQAMLQRKIDGVIHLEHAHNDAEAAHAAKRYPVVERKWAVNFPGTNVPHVAVNYEVAFRRLMDRWAEARRGCIGLVVEHADPGVLNPKMAKARLYLEALAERNLAREENQWTVVAGESRERVLESTYEKTLGLLRNNPRIDALVIDTGELAVPAYKAIKEAGRTIGKDLAVAAWTDTQELPFLDPAVAVMDEPTDEVARNLVRLLMAQLNGGGTPASVELPTFLIERPSLGM